MLGEALGGNGENGGTLRGATSGDPRGCVGATHEGSLTI